MSALGAVVRSERPRLMGAVVLGVAAAALEIAPAFGIYLAALRVYRPSEQTPSIPWIAVGVSAAVALRYVLVGGSLILSHGAAFRLMRRLRGALTRKLSTVPRSFFDMRSPGELKKCIVEDVDALEGAFAHHVPEGASGVVAPMLALLVLVTIDWRLALAGLSLVPVAFLTMALSMRGYEEMMERWHASERRANEVVLELLRGLLVLKSYGRVASEMRRVRDGVLGVRDFADRINRRSTPAYTAFGTLLSSNLVVVLPVAVALYRAEQIDEPVLLLFLALGYGLTAPLLKLMFLFGTVQMNRIRAGRIEEVLSAGEEASEHRGQLDARAAGVRLEGVEYRYDAARGPALRDVSLHIEPGAHVALVGPSGAGKSTLAQLIAGARRPEVGSISLEVDGVSRPVRGAVSMVGQKAQLFHGSLADNLRLAVPEASDAALLEVLSAAGLEPMLRRLPDGLATPVGEDGARLSGGEAQRLTVARALLRDRPVIVLDEVTSQLDAESERAVQEGIDRLAEGHTLVVVAHRLATVRHADRIVVMEDGRVVDSGTHGALLERCALYRRMWRSQESAAGWRVSVEHAEDEASAASLSDEEP